MDALIDGKCLAKILAMSVMLSIGLGLSSCKKPVASESESEAPAAALSGAVTPAPATTQPVAQATPPPAPSTPELAPSGVFYLVAAARVETSDGIVGLPPGSGVKLVRPGIYLTTAGEVSLNPNQLTNDMGVARRAAAQEKSTQSALQQQRVATQAAIQKASALNAATPSPSGSKESPNAALRNELNHQLDVNAQQTSEVTAALNEFVPRFGSWGQAAKKSPQALQLSLQYDALVSERQELTAKLAQLH